MDTIEIYLTLWSFEQRNIPNPHKKKDGILSYISSPYGLKRKNLQKLKAFFNPKMIK